MKMICKRPYRGRPGDTAFLYGYPGVFGDDGAAVLDVPEAFAATELASGRLGAVPGEPETIPATGRATATATSRATATGSDGGVRKARGAARGGSVPSTAA